MHASRTQKGHWVRFVAEILIILCSVGLLAQAEDKNKKPAASPPPRAAAPAKAPARAPAATASKPTVTAPTTGGGTKTLGPTTSKPTVTAPTTGGGTKTAGPTTSKPTVTAPTTGGRTKTAGPTTGTPGGRPAPTAASGTKPASTTTGTPGGHPEHRANAGLSGRPAPTGSHQTRLQNGSAVQRRPNGRVSDVHDARRGMDVHRGLNGSRRVSVERPDHSRIVAERGRAGYVQRPYMYHGHEFARRTYYYNGRAYDRYYRGYSYHGVYMHVYAPFRYYPVAFYGWAYNPWFTPVVYPWGWAGNPWFGYYGFYFTPYPVYASPALWLTDYLLAANLTAAYAAQQEVQAQAAARQAPEGAAALTPEVKQMIADEVKNQIALENAEAQQNARNQDIDPASSSISRLLKDGHTHVFVVGSALDVVDASGAECALSDGDVLKLVAPPEASDTEANLVVLSSKGGLECRKAAVVSVAFADLQDMQNHMREIVDQGLQELQEKQGKGGLPTAPPSAMAAPVNTAFAQSAPPPDANAIAEINQQLKEADLAEQDVVSQAQLEPGAAPPTTAAAPKTIAVGQSINEVTAILGPPVTVVDLGSKKIYKYKDLKISFKDGKVADVE